VVVLEGESTSRSVAFFISVVPALRFRLRGYLNDVFILLLPLSDRILTDAQRTDHSFARSLIASLPLSFYQRPLHLSHDRDHAP
jgi:hypothetical protein